jgi:hypothetical protein
MVRRSVELLRLVREMGELFVVEGGQFGDIQQRVQLGLAARREALRLIGKHRGSEPVGFCTRARICAQESGG